MSILPRRYSENPQKNKGHKLKFISPTSGGQSKKNFSSEQSMDELNPNSRTKLNGVKSDKRKSLHLNMSSSNPAPVKLKRNFMSLESEDLDEKDIYGIRKNLAKRLQMTSTNIFRVVLIISYCLLTFVCTSIDEDLDKGAVMAIYHTFELIFIIFFVIEILVYKYAFKEMYHLNKFNLTNSILVCVIIVFWAGDIFISSYTISILLRMRGVMRLIHIPAICENLQSHMRKKTENTIYRDGKKIKLI